MRFAAFAEAPESSGGQCSSPLLAVNADAQILRHVVEPPQ
jgi:hypothetical protein